MKVRVQLFIKFHVNTEYRVLRTEYIFKISQLKVMDCYKYNQILCSSQKLLDVLLKIISNKSSHPAVAGAQLVSTSAVQMLHRNLKLPPNCLGLRRYLGVWRQTRVNRKQNSD
ncbi:uncharacterized protein CIMG_13772 [Coccidioides immitis RS]|uniref:Uncharacterized protein n=1 Tax=Coccidioides immitis (strain RS) TaxID=246410 RepID=J3KCW0_COCIM|nr:uncharacterized protein CIMG_13772 [Coccidioides immitis RS]EAS33120.3 hypothetical protein CIMG_13772 [Coccidioides immitis RS]